MFLSSERILYKDVIKRAQSQIKPRFIMVCRAKVSYVKMVFIL